MKTPALVCLALIFILPDAALATDHDLLCRDYGTGNLVGNGYKAYCQKSLDGSYLGQTRVTSMIQCSRLCDTVPGCIGFSLSFDARCSFYARGTKLQDNTNANVGLRDAPVVLECVDSCVGLSANTDGISDYKGYELLCERDFVGGDYSENNQVYNFQACIDLCENDSQCVGSSFFRNKGGTLVSGQCYLKNKLTSASSTRNGDFARRLGQRPDTDSCAAITARGGTVGNEYRVQCGRATRGRVFMTKPATTMLQCSNLCDEMPGCKGFMLRNNRECQFVTDENSNYDDTNSHLAIRYAPRLQRGQGSCAHLSGDGGGFPGFSLSCNTDLHGNDFLEKFYTSTFEECVGFCANNTICVGASYFKSGKDMPEGGRCALKTKLSPSETHESCDFAFKITPEDATPTETVTETITEPCPSKCCYTQYF